MAVERESRRGVVRRSRSRRWAAVAIILSSLAVACGGTDGAGTSDVQASLQRAVDRFLAARDIPGASVALIEDGELVRAVSGLADPDAERKVVFDDEFRLASITKTYVAALAVELSHDGVVSLDDTVGRWIPNLPAPLARLRVVTLRQLLSHTSGLAQTSVADRDRGLVLTTDEVLARIPPSVCEPGRCWNYADGNYVVAGLVLEAAAGAPVSAQIDQRFVDPLGLAHTRFIDDGETGVVPQFSLASDEAGRPLTPHHLLRQQLPIVANDAAGGMQASASDLARWGDALFGARITTRSDLRTLVDTTAMRGLPCPNRCPFSYGLGVFHLMVGGHQLLGHDGTSGAVLVHDRERATTIAIVTNGGERDTGAFLRAILDALESSK